MNYVVNTSVNKASLVDKCLVEVVISTWAVIVVHYLAFYSYAMNWETDRNREFREKNNTIVDQ